MLNFRERSLRIISTVLEHFITMFDVVLDPPLEVTGPGDVHYLPHRPVVCDDKNYQYQNSFPRISEKQVDRR